MKGTNRDFNGLNIIYLDYKKKHDQKKNNKIILQNRRKNGLKIRKNKMDNKLKTAFIAHQKTKI